MEPTQKGRSTAIEKWIRKLVECSQDPFWLLDKLLVLAGAPFTPRNRSQRIVWILYQTTTYFQLSISLVCSISFVIFEEDSVTVIRTFLMFLTMTLSFVKLHLLLQNSSGISKLRDLLEAPGFCSGDPDFDESVRKRFKRTSRMLIITIAWIVMVQQILSWIPSDTQGIIFKLPAWVAWCFGDRVSLVIKNWYMSLCFTIWCNKLYACTITVVVVMLGLEAEQTILAHKFGRIQDSLQNLRQSYWDREIARKQYWERLRTLIRVSFDQQQLLLRHLKELQSLVQNLFFYVYYSALILFGSDIFIATSNPSVFMYVAVAGTVLVSSLECFSLCYLVDCLKDAFESISEHMFYLCARLPYSEDHHNDYLDTRATLQIIARCSRNAVTFGCAGVSEISIAVFTDMLNICYSVFTFLRETI
ncbi:uncharacterized protein LOC6048849 [Culex quinquefasciatus]|uniref:uncharacterized protein LOC6048849 n=1 Tax=Culex quinquefasciatus TaxID=7176 RepID=UPI0018E2C8CC|nr:uncharacterized protein LOC6048849 [Culex quinquefasciatus]